jgi:LysR family cys regulon transcriptional activator
VKLQQLRYLIAIARNGLNISAAAESLYTSQPGVSKQLKLLEEELGILLFNRNGKQLTHITPAGRQIIARAESIMREVGNIKALAAEFRDEHRGNLSIATTHTQARYALPPVVKAFRERYPEVTLQMQQGTPEQIAEMAASGRVDFAIATEALELFDDLVMLPCYRWNRCILVPPGHALASSGRLDLATVARYPLVTYVFGFTGRSHLDAAFDAQGLKPNVVFTAADADVIKTYVRLGLGVGILARMAYDPEHDQDLVRLDAGHLFESSTTKIGFRRGAYLRAYMYDFLALFAPHLTLKPVDQAAHAPDQAAVDRMFADVTLPMY